MTRKNENTYYHLPILDGMEVLNARRYAQNFPFHSHDTFNITLVLEQPFSTRLADRLLHAPAGSITITHPGEVHASLCDSLTGSSFFTFYISPEVLQPNNRERVLFENRVLDDPSLFRQLHALSVEITKQPLLLERRMITVLNQLVQQHATREPGSPREPEMFRRFLEEDSLEKFSLEKTARHFGMDRFKFLRLFKLYTGLTPNNYVILRRIEKGKRLLRFRDDLLGIAIETGFYDSTHFCRHFKRVTGVTPMAWRRAMGCNIVL